MEGPIIPLTFTHSPTKIVLVLSAPGCGPFPPLDMYAAWVQEGRVAEIGMETSSEATHASWQALWAKWYEWIRAADKTIRVEVAPDKTLKLEDVKTLTDKADITIVPWSEEADDVSLFAAAGRMGPKEKEED